MATRLAAHRNPARLALLGGILLIAGLGAGPHAGYADDDDWHTEANRPVEPEQLLKDREEIQRIAAAKPQHEQVYAPRSTVRPGPAERYIDSAYQTATIDRPNH